MWVLVISGIVDTRGEIRPMTGLLVSTRETGGAWPCDYSLRFCHSMYQKIVEYFSVLGGTLCNSSLVYIYDKNKLCIPCILFS